jgi:hypothetical protein
MDQYRIRFIQQKLENVIADDMEKIFLYKHNNLEPLQQQAHTPLGQIKSCRFV